MCPRLSYNNLKLGNGAISISVIAHMEINDYYKAATKYFLPHSSLTPQRDNEVVMKSGVVVPDSASPRFD